MSENGSSLHDAVMAALSTVIEPELHRDIVSLNMVRDLEVENGTAAFTIVLTTPACPLKDVFLERCHDALVGKVPGIERINIQWDANVPTDRRIHGRLDVPMRSIAPPPTYPNPNFSTQPDPFNQTTTEDLGTLFTMLYDCERYNSGAIQGFPDGEFTPTECRQMLELMSANDLERLLQGGIPNGVRISHKNGWDGLTMHGDAGIVYSPNGNDYVIAVFVWEDSDFFSFEIAWPLIEEISRAAWNHFNPENPLLTRRADLPTFAAECEGNYLPPYGRVNLNDINSWRRGS